jgi:HSP20 family molecular chaperone IbpA
MNTILRYNNVWDILDTFNNELNNNSWYNDFSHRHRASGHYNETENGYEYELELPGYKKKDVSISAVDGVVTINAARGEKTRKFSVRVSEDAELSTITGQLADGLLTLKVEKQEKAKPIAVKLK